MESWPLNEGENAIEAFKQKKRRRKVKRGSKLER